MNDAERELALAMYAVIKDLKPTASSTDLMVFTWLRDVMAKAAVALEDRTAASTFDPLEFIAVATVGSVPGRTVEAPRPPDVVPLRTGDRFCPEHARMLELEGFTARASEPGSRTFIGPDGDDRTLVVFTDEADAITKMTVDGATYPFITLTAARLRETSKVVRQMTPYEAAQAKRLAETTTMDPAILREHIQTHNDEEMK